MRGIISVGLLGWEWSPYVCGYITLYDRSALVVRVHLHWKYPHTLLLLVQLGLQGL